MRDNSRRRCRPPAALVTLTRTGPLPHTRPPGGRSCARTIALPALLFHAADLIPDRAGIYKRAHVSAIESELRHRLAQIGIGVTSSAYQAWADERCDRGAKHLPLGRLY